MYKSVGVTLFKVSIDGVTELVRLCGWRLEEWARHIHTSS